MTKLFGHFRTFLIRFTKREVYEKSVYEKGGVEGCSNRAQKTHSFVRTHVLDSKLTLTHHKRNDAGERAGVCVCEKERESERKRERIKTAS